MYMNKPYGIHAPQWKSCKPFKLNCISSVQKWNWFIHVQGFCVFVNCSYIFFVPTHFATYYQTYTTLPYSRTELSDGLFVLRTCIHLSHVPNDSNVLILHTAAVCLHIYGYKSYYNKSIRRLTFHPYILTFEPWLILSIPEWEWHWFMLMYAWSR